MIRNPVLPGFNPDPSFCRVGEDYYLATSTFEWYPGVQIHHSRDLVNWTLVARPLNRAALLDMRGNPDSCGIWAPCLSYADGKFWLVYTDVKRFDGAFKDAHNYITTCETIDGVWSDPWYVNSSGFDPSLFHDDDGRKYFVNMQWNHRGSGTGGNPVHDSFDGILVQEWSPERGLTGPVTNVWAGTERGLAEAPHLFKRNGWYYLTTAEGGTGYDHAVSMARSRVITGPYETHPNKHLICAADAPDSPIQRTGHGQYVETPDGQVYHSFLMGRPMPGPDGKGRFCPMGRETGLERCTWGDDDWLYLEAGGTLVRQELPGLADVEPEAPQRVDYRFDTLPDDFQWLRTPEPERIFRCEGDLVLIGRESLGSWFE
ncbi:MAG: family 43 glycosylhydrolase, partial [Maritimibacter sp.]